MLLLGLAVVVMLLVGVTVDASAAYLRRQGLDNLADGAVLAAAEGVQGRQVYAGGLGETALIDPVVARAYVAVYLMEVDAVRAYPVCATPSMPRTTAWSSPSGHRSTCRCDRPAGAARRRSARPLRRTSWSVSEPVEQRELGLGDRTGRSGQPQPDWLAGVVERYRPSIPMP